MPDLLLFYDKQPLTAPTTFISGQAAALTDVEAPTIFHQCNDLFKIQAK